MTERAGRSERRERVLLLGAAGRDFHDFNVLYRDDTTDTAWTTFPRGDIGYLTIRRFGGSGTAMVATDDVEVWYVRVITRSPTTLDRNNVQMFTVDFATLEEPVLDAVVA